MSLSFLIEGTQSFKLNRNTVAVKRKPATLDPD